MGTDAAKRIHGRTEAHRGKHDGPLAAAWEQTIQKQREIVDAEILEHGAHLDDEDVGSVAVLKDQADCMQVLASKAQDLFFYFQNIWLLCLMRLMCLM